MKFLSRAGHCDWPDCSTAIHARRMCQRHYVAWRTTTVAPDSSQACSELGCARLLYAKELCAMHYQRVRKDIDPSLRKRKASQGAESHARRMENDAYAALIRQRASERGRAAYLLKQQIDIVLARYGTDCHICGGAIDLEAPRHAGGGEGWERGLHLDHVTPVSRGGTDDLTNIRPSHAFCNVSKGAGRRVTPYDLEKIT